MKKITIQKSEMGIVYNQRGYSRVLAPGTHWLWFGEVAVRESKTHVHPLTKDNLHLPKEANFADKATLLDVKDNHLAVVYIDGHYSRILKAGKYYYWNGFSDYTFEMIDLNKIEITENLSKELFRKADFYHYVRTFEVKSYEKALLFIDEQFEKSLDKGIYRFWQNSTKIEVLKVDMRKQIMDVLGQDILTKDKAAIRVNCFVDYQVKDLEKALMNNKEYKQQLYLLTQLAVREFIGTKTLDELLNAKELVGDYIKKELMTKAQKLGIAVHDAGMKDIILPGDIKEIMNQVLLAQKQAQANTIKRREETASTRNLLNTAKLMEDNQMLLKLKEMEYIEKIADKVNNISLSGGHQILDQLNNIFTRD